MFTEKRGTRVSTESKLTDPPSLNLLTNQRDVHIRKFFRFLWLIYANYNIVELFFSITEVLVFSVESQRTDSDKLYYQSYVHGSLQVYVPFISSTDERKRQQHEFVKCEPLINKMR
jgi:hypothetical protein